MHSRDAFTRRYSEPGAGVGFRALAARTTSVAALVTSTTPTDSPPKGTASPIGAGLVRNQQQSGLDTVGSPCGMTGLGEGCITWLADGLSCEVGIQATKRAVAGTRIRGLRSGIAICCPPEMRIKPWRKSSQGTK